MMIDTATDAAIDIVERGLLPDAAMRWGVRQLCAQRLRQSRRDRASDVPAFLERARAAEVAPVPHKANAQHYEVPTEFFQLMLGPRLKYSGCWWNDGVTSLGQAEDDALALTAEHADITDGMSILELGCGWGSLSLWMAEHFPNSHIVGVSNSSGQRTHIMREAARRGLANLEIRTADMNVFEPGRHFDRIVSVEMFEHMRNYETLFRRIEGWLEPEGRLFIHVFCHNRFTYLFEERGPGNWMGRHFFSGGVMPSIDLLPSVPSGFSLERRWDCDGRHYERTANAWLANLDANRDEARRILARVYGEREADRWVGRWRLFLIACAELFGYDEGAEWGVAHYRFAKRS